VKIAVIGKGHVGTALATGLKRKGHEIRFGHRDPKEPVLDAAKWSEVIILAVPYRTVKDVARVLGSAVDGKVVVDVTNVLGPDMELAVGFSTSGAEEVQKLLPQARVVKAFNTVFAANQSTGKVGKEQLSAFVAGDDAKAKQTVMRLAADIGFDPVDAGPLKSARYLEPMGKLMIQLGNTLNVGTNLGYKIVKG